jgi:Tfp pilus assembly protein PilV
MAPFYFGIKHECQTARRKMKAIIKKTPASTMGKKSRTAGFTLIETLISLFLVLIGVLFITKVIIFSLDLNKKSLIRLKLWQQVNNQMHTLLSKPYNSEKLLPGNFTTTRDTFRIKWTITPITSTLKKIDLSVSYKQFLRKSYGYKSKTINTNPDLLNHK